MTREHAFGFGVDAGRALVPALAQLELVTNSVPLENTLQFKAPPSGNYAPPGYSMIIAITAAGIPSVAKWIQVTP